MSDQSIMNETNGQYRHKKALAFDISNSIL